jgi:hypothetical protein
VACFTPLTLWGPDEAVCRRLGAALIFVFVLATWRAYRSRGPWDLVAGGIALLAATLGPVLLQRSRVGTPYVCLAALGGALAVVGGCELAGRHGRQFAIAIALVLLVLDETTAERAWRQPELFHLVTDGAHFTARWMATVQRGAVRANGEVEVLVPQNPVTASLFQAGNVQSFFPGMPRRVSIYDAHQRPVAKPGQAVLDVPIAVSSPDDYPGAERRWHWLRELGRPFCFRYAGSRSIPRNTYGRSPPWR